MKTAAVVDRIRETYTETRACVVDSAPAFNVFLKVGMQEFRVTPQEFDDADDADHFRLSLAIAIHRLVNNETGRDSEQA